LQDAQSQWAHSHEQSPHEQSAQQPAASGPLSFAEAFATVNDPNSNKPKNAASKSKNAGANTEKRVMGLILTLVVGKMELSTFGASIPSFQPNAMQGEQRGAGSESDSLAIPRIARARRISKRVGRQIAGENTFLDLNSHLDSTIDRR
jgi:hypothetical protein